MKTFKLPDLGEGLPDAEIVEWLVQEGEEVKVDQPLVSMETAKAVVEVPSPFAGKLVKQHGQAGDTINTGDALAEFEVDEDAQAEQEAEHKPAQQKAEKRQDSGTVVGAMESSDKVVRERTSSTGGIKVTPAVRAMARKLKVDLSQVTPSGKDGQISVKDVREFAEGGSKTGAQTRQAPQPEAIEGAQPLKGPRRSMARFMAQSHAQIVPTTLCEDADIGAWGEGQDITVRLLRSIVAACKAEPGLNAWFDGAHLALKGHDTIDVGLAVDTPDGLFVPALRDVGNKDAKALRQALDELRQGVKDRSIPPEELRGYTIMLSNFGVFTGRYATPVINPPCVAIIAAGKGRDAVAVKNGKPAVTRLVPLSLTFDHRAVTGGEAARFLKALIEDLEQPK